MAPMRTVGYQPVEVEVKVLVHAIRIFGRAMPFFVRMRRFLDVAAKNFGRLRSGPSMYRRYTGSN